MSYLYGDSTPSKLEVNYIEFLRDAVEFCVQVLVADQRIGQGRAQTRSLEHATAERERAAAETGRLVGKSFEGATLGAGDSATARCAAEILKSASDLVRAEAVTMRSALEAEIARREAQAALERDGCVKALETLVMKHDLPEMSVDVHLAITGGSRYAGRSRMKTGFGLDAVMDLEVPAGHLFERVIRVDRLMERLDVQAPEIGGWLHKEVKQRAQHLEKHHIAEFSMGSSSGLIKLRLQPDGTGPGFDVLFSKEAPRVRLARAEQQDGAGEPPFEVRTTTPRSCSRCRASSRRRRSSWPTPAAAGRGADRRRGDALARQTDGAGRTADRRTWRRWCRRSPARSHSPGELVLRRLLSGDRREEIFLSKSELQAEDRGAAGVEPGAVRPALGERGTDGAGGSGASAGEGRGQRRAPDRRDAAARADDPASGRHAVARHAAAGHLGLDAPAHRRQIGGRRAEACPGYAGGRRHAPHTDRRDGGVGGAERRGGDDRRATRAAPCARGASRIGDAAAVGIRVEDAARQPVPPGHAPQGGGGHDRREARRHRGQGLIRLAGYGTDLACWK